MITVKREVIASVIGIMLLNLCQRFGLLNAVLTLPDIGATLTLRKGRLRTRLGKKQAEPVAKAASPQLALLRYCHNPECGRIFKPRTGPLGGGGANQLYCDTPCQQAVYRKRRKEREQRARA